MTTRAEEARAAARELWADLRQLGATGVACFDAVAPYLVVYYPREMFREPLAWSLRHDFGGFPVYVRSDGVITPPRPAH